MTNGCHHDSDLMEVDQCELQAESAADETASSVAAKQDQDQDATTDVAPGTESDSQC